MLKARREAGALGIGRDCLALALFAILIGPDIRGARSAEIGDRFRATVFARFFVFSLVPMDVRKVAVVDHRQ